MKSAVSPGWDYTLCRSSDEVVKSLFTHSFAIIRVSDELKSLLQIAWLEAKDFFEKTSLTCKLNSRANKKGVGLLGWNEPSYAKEIFRCYDNGPLEQPWPNSKFQSASSRLAQKLYILLYKCFLDIKYHYQTLSASSSFNNREPNRKKRKLLKTHYINEKTSQTNSIEYGAKFNLKMNDDTYVMPNSFENKRNLPYYSSCPLDYYYYHNRHKNIRVVNCSEHIDRGLLICISLTDVIGLQVQSQSDQLWYIPEKISNSESLYNERLSGVDSGLLCIMVGDQLQHTLSSLLHSHEMIDSSVPLPQPCRHSVKETLTRARLSMSFELRGT